jgi:hypothetical protein
MLKKILDACSKPCSSINFNTRSLYECLHSLEWPLCLYSTETGTPTILIGKLLMNHRYRTEGRTEDRTVDKEAEDTINSIREIRSKVAELNDRSIIIVTNVDVLYEQYSYVT